MELHTSSTYESRLAETTLQAAGRGAAEIAISTITANFVFQVSYVIFHDFLESNPVLKTTSKAHHKSKGA